MAITLLVRARRWEKRRRRAEDGIDAKPKAFNDAENGRRRSPTNVDRDQPNHTCYENGEYATQRNPKKESQCITGDIYIII